MVAVWVPVTQQITGMDCMPLLGLGGPPPCHDHQVDERPFDNHPVHLLSLGVVPPIQSSEPLSIPAGTNFARRVAGAANQLP